MPLTSTPLPAGNRRDATAISGGATVTRADDVLGLEAHLEERLGITTAFGPGLKTLLENVLEVGLGAGLQRR